MVAGLLRNGGWFGPGFAAGHGKFAEKKAKRGKKASKEAGAEAIVGDGGDGERGVAVAPWSVGEVEKVCRVLAEAGNGGTGNGKLDEKLRAALKGAGEAFRHESADIALFGRMATAGLMRSVDGALSLGHVITTHAVAEDLDWFTAMDDLKDPSESKEEAGAGHLNTQEFGAGVFYRYASLNIRQLRENLGEADRAHAMDVGAHLARMLATVVPAAKQRSFAAHNPADFVMASLTDIPVSAANAFEAPVKTDAGGGFLMASVAAFEDYMTRVYAGYGLGDQQAVFSLPDTGLKPRLATIQELEAWMRGQ